MIAVSIAPAISPSIGLENIVKKLVNCGLSLSGSTAPLIISIPNIRTAKLIRMFPVSLLLSFLANINSIMPITARIGEKELGFSI